MYLYIIIIIIIIIIILSFVNLCYLYYGTSFPEMNNMSLNPFSHVNSTILYPSN